MTEAAVAWNEMQEQARIAWNEKQEKEAGGDGEAG